MDIFSENETIISEIINRLLNCRNTNRLYVFGRLDKELTSLYSAVRIETVKEAEELTGDVSYIRISDINSLRKVLPWIMKHKKRQDFIIYVPQETDLPYENLEVLGMPHYLNRYSKLQGAVYMVGISFQFPSELFVPNDFKVLAIMHFFNEVDVITETIQHLLDQGIDIYLLDNWSDDGSFELAQQYQQAYPDRICLERFPASGKSSTFELYRQLEKTERISLESDYDWFIHYDADEIRISPWKNVRLREAIYWIDQQGYNCIENTVVDFRLTKQDKMRTDSIFMCDTFFDFRHKKKWFDQVKTWKKSEAVDLKSSGGHFVRVAVPRIYPLKILNRHYPLRSVQQAQKKVFCDRLPRFQKEKKERGWHVQYDNVQEKGDLFYDASQLLLWKQDTFDKLYIPLFLECGLRWEKYNQSLEFDLPDLDGKKIFLYGAGKMGQEIYRKAADGNYITGWADKNYLQIPMIYCEKIITPEDIKNKEFDYLVLAVKNETIQQEIIQWLKQQKIPEEKIIIGKARSRHKHTAEDCRTI